VVLSGSQLSLLLEIREPRVPEIGAIPAPIVIEPPIPIEPPLGFPIINMPCALTREEATSGTSSYDLDPDGNVVLCDGGAPAFIPLQITPSIKAVPLIPEVSDYVAPEKKKEKPKKKNEIPEIGDLSLQEALNLQIPCPAPDALPIGAKGKYQFKAVKGYERNEFGECITLWRDLSALNVLNNYTPPPTQVLTVGATTFISATLVLTARPASQLLMKIVKPLVKTVTKKILKKKEKVLSYREKIIAQRERNRAIRLWTSLKK